MLLFLLLACLLPYTHQMAQRPVIGKPAPAWSGQAVVNGEIKTISLKDFQGEEYGAGCKFAYIVLQAKVYDYLGSLRNICEGVRREIPGLILLSGTPFPN